MIPLQEMTATAALSLKLGEVDRATQHPDGRPEVVTTHSHMLGLCAMRLLRRSSVPGLDQQLVYEFTLVHDLPEAHAPGGDTNTMRALDADAKAAKDAREAIGLDVIRREAPWIAEKIDHYERQDCAEAEFVHLLDKIMPKLTHYANGCAAWRAAGYTLDQLRESHRLQGAKLRAQHPRFHNLHRLFDEACAASEAAWGPE